MTTKLTQLIREFEGTGVEIIIDNGNLEFELYSTGMALGYMTSNGYAYKTRIEKIVLNADISTISHGVKNYLNEEMLYDFMLEARTEKCKSFRKWVTGIVLPSIRQNGGYIDSDATEKQVEKLIRKWGSQYCTEEIHDRKSIRKYIREYDPMKLDECIREIVNITIPMKGDIKHELLDTAIKELKKIDKDLMKDTIKHTYIKDTASEGIITLQDVKIGKYKRRISMLEN
ncbi:Bro-N domain-containing protein [Clostridium botulinum]|uniref:BRO-N domain-containing protein n=1 Tax=Clostridium botulinum TaxID=1491 RepID=UPI001E484EEA|nr:BRO family protein [Clostridium botulinum]MCD3223957.1 hypothetical protein [Clostridium botulinum C/D]MCD3298030.1 hypothetical protein [Clostridium botulinum C/D]